MQAHTTVKHGLETEINSTRQMGGYDILGNSFAVLYCDLIKISGQAMETEFLRTRARVPDLQTVVQLRIM